VGAVIEAVSSEYEINIKFKQNVAPAELQEVNV